MTADAIRPQDMSGGSYDYAFRHIEDLADSIREIAGCPPGPNDKPDEYGSPPSLRRAFAEHLRKVARAAHAIEWNDSGDGARDEQKAIRACIAPDDEVKAATEHALEALADLQAALAVAAKGGAK